MRGRLFREPDERSGPAILDREPILFPEQRKEAKGRVERLIKGDR